jgi:gentisate 1,2-dioxygenase
VRARTDIGRQGLSETPRNDAALIQALALARIHPLWDRYKRITPVAPQPRDAPMHWRWRDIEPFTERAATEVGIEDVERRALILVNPAFGGETVTTQNLIGAFTVLEPGDRAVPHRHTAAAIRFSTRAEGAVTIVNGQRCEMKEGDLVLTPPMCWHGHINQGKRRTVWFDAANMPAICALDASFFEPGTRQDERFWEVGDEGAAQYRFPGEQMRRQLAEAPVGPDGAKSVRYTRNGGSVMPTLDLFLTRIDRPTRSRRATHNAIYLVVSGEGRSTVDERSFEWSRHDVFTVPHWTWASHEPRGGTADLLVVTDRAIYERLELLREEIR